jgi:hypothetical protein
LLAQFPNNALRRQPDFAPVIVALDVTMDIVLVAFMAGAYLVQTSLPDKQLVASRRPGFECRSRKLTIESHAP